MDTKLLIDAIVRQTTVLIAQLSTAAGIRAPLAHVADQVFVALAQEIESTARSEPRRSWPIGDQESAISSLSEASLRYVAPDVNCFATSGCSAPANSSVPSSTLA